MWVFWGWGKICQICVCIFLKLLKCQKYKSEKVGQFSLFIPTLAVNYFRKTVHLRFLAGFWIRFCIPRDLSTSLNICLSALLFRLFQTAITNSRSNPSQFIAARLHFYLEILHSIFYIHILFYIQILRKH